MSAKNLFALATRAQVGHIFDAVEEHFLSLPRSTAQEIVTRGLPRYQELHRQVVKTLAVEYCIQPYPGDGEIFELTLDCDAVENRPFEMIRRYDSYGPQRWEHKGLEFSGKQTCRFKLVRAANCRNLNEVRKKLKGSPRGQWINAFKAAYPQPDGQGPIGVADPSWVDPSGEFNFPCISGDTEGGLCFNSVDEELDDGWRWLVAVIESA